MRPPTKGNFVETVDFKLFKKRNVSSSCFGSFAAMSANGMSRKVLQILELPELDPPL